MFSCSPLSCRDGIIVSSKPHHEPEARQEMKTGEQGWNDKRKKKKCKSGNSSFNIVTNGFIQQQVRESG